MMTAMIPNTHRKNQIQDHSLIGLTELTSPVNCRHTARVSLTTGQQTAKFRDSYPHPRRPKTRQSVAGFFMPVDYATHGLMPGSRGLQHGVSQNKRVATLGSDTRTRQILPTRKIIQGTKAMTAYNAMGTHAQKPAATLPAGLFSPTPLTDLLTVQQGGVQ